MFLGNDYFLYDNAHQNLIRNMKLLGGKICILKLFAQFFSLQSAISVLCFFYTIVNYLVCVYSAPF